MSGTLACSVYRNATWGYLSVITASRGYQGYQYWPSSLSIDVTFFLICSFLFVDFLYLSTLSNLLLEPKPKMSRCPWESVAAKCCPSGLHLQSNSAPWPWPSICPRGGERRDAWSHDVFTRWSFTRSAAEFSSSYLRPLAQSLHNLFQTRASWNNTTAVINATVWRTRRSVTHSLWDYDFISLFTVASVASGFSRVPADDLLCSGQFIRAPRVNSGRVLRPQLEKNITERGIFFSFHFNKSKFSE